MVKSKYSKLSLKCMTDESLVRMLIEVSMHKVDPHIPIEAKPTIDEAASVVSELINRLAKIRKYESNAHA